MLPLTSRYAEGTFGVVKDGHAIRQTVYVYRKFNVTHSPIKYYVYTMRVGDRIDVLASVLYGKPQLWHKIMDINPEILEPFHIKPGTVIRIPID
jgi:nucleoid-associated protein YgaU